MPQGLPTSRLVRVEVNLTPLAIPFLNFDTLLVIGDSDVIDVRERIRTYGSMTEVAEDFGSTSPEFLAAELYFAQIPQPAILYIGRWAQAATAGLLHGGILSALQQQMTNWTSINDGGFRISIDGDPVADVYNLDFSLETNLNGVATQINTVLNGVGASIAWDGQRFTVTSATTGTSSEVSFATAAVGHTDISAQLKLTAATASVAVPGISAETALEAVIILDQQATKWYACMFAVPEGDLTDDASNSVALYIEASSTSNPHLYGVTTTDPNAIDPLSSADIGSLFKSESLYRSVVQYSDNPYAIASFFGRAFTVDFAAQNSVLTMMYKIEPDVVPQGLSSTAADALQLKRINVYASYLNGAAIIQYGVVSGPAYFDEMHGLDWLANQIQTDVFNLLYTTPTNIPQTDAGTNQIVNAVNGACAAGVNNGLVAPGQWNAPGFGTLKQGDFLPLGYYVFAPPVATQPQADREARKSVPIQVAVKLAGAIHTVDIMVLVNR